MSNACYDRMPDPQALRAQLAAIREAEGKATAFMLCVCRDEEGGTYHLEAFPSNASREGVKAVANHIEAAVRFLTPTNLDALESLLAPAAPPVEATPSGEEVGRG